MGEIEKKNEKKDTNMKIILIFAASFMGKMMPQKRE